MFIIGPAAPQEKALHALRFAKLCPFSASAARVAYFGSHFSQFFANASTFSLVTGMSGLTS